MPMRSRRCNKTKWEPTKLTVSLGFKKMHERFSPQNADASKGKIACNRNRREPWVLRRNLAATSLRKDDIWSKADGCRLHVARECEALAAVVDATTQ